MKKILSLKTAGVFVFAAFLFPCIQSKAQSQLLMRHLAAMYKGKTNVSIDTLPDKNFLFCWSEDDRIYRAYYDKTAQWSGTTVSYDEAGLPQWVRNRLKMQYSGFTISFVTEIWLPDNVEPVYRVQLEDANILLFVQVNEDEIAEEKRLRKQP